MTVFQILFVSQRCVHLGDYDHVCQDTLNSNSFDFFSSNYRQLPESDLTVPCLGLLTNLCRHNLPIQAHIKALVSAYLKNCTGCKESRFYSLAFGQACTSPGVILFARQLIPRKCSLCSQGIYLAHNSFFLISRIHYSSLKKLHLPVRQVKNRIHQFGSKIYQLALGYRTHLIFACCFDASN